MFGPRLHFAPALPMQRAVDDGVMDRVAEFLLISLAYGRRYDHLASLGLLDKGSQQTLLFLDGEVGTIATTAWLVVQGRFALL